MARIDVIRQLFSSLLGKNTLLMSVLSCHFISNVPSAILLSQFTGNYADLLVGVNIGGVGTLIASLASLITFREYVKNNPGKTGYYVKMFSVFNFAFLIILVAVMMLISVSGTSIQRQIINYNSTLDAENLKMHKAVNCIKTIHLCKSP